mmetsp:Transcript_13712/g.18377  ORF Transcript_13712/g.18377 Transcript_13712/m.18377 type:complete len:450 (+) Transcript_13712:56-1405(+)
MAPEPFSSDNGLSNNPDSPDQKTNDDVKPTSNGAFAPLTDADPPSMTVLAIYGRAPIPREDELPPKYKTSQLQKDQIFCRRRLRTKPLFEGEEDSDDVADGDVNSQNDPAIEDDDCPADEKVADISRVGSTADEYEAALFIPKHGLVGSTFFHADQEEHGDMRPVLEERAILFQSIEHYSKLMSNPTLGVYVLPEKLLKAQEEGDEENMRFDESNDEHIELVLENNTFGEQVLVRGIEGSSISVGDIFEVEGGLSPLVVEVTSPRHPCAFIDRKHKSPFGVKGLRRYCMTHALAGWFTRVLVPGELRDGMVFTRTAHPYPKWTMTEIAKALYSEGDKKELSRGTAHWKRSIEELRELCQLKPLGNYEWKDKALHILETMEKELEEREEKEVEKAEGDGMKKRETLEEAEDDSSFFLRLSQSFNSACDIWCSASELLFYCEPSPEQASTA